MTISIHIPVKTTLFLFSECKRDVPTPPPPILKLTHVSSSVRSGYNQTISCADQFRVNFRAQEIVTERMFEHPSHTPCESQRIHHAWRKKLHVYNYVMLWEAEFSFKHSSKQSYVCIRLPPRDEVHILWSGKLLVDSFIFRKSRRLSADRGYLLEAVRR